MNCYLCNHPITKANKSGLCLKCKTNPNLTLAKSKAKNLYVLTEDQINTGIADKKIRSYTFEGKGDSVVREDVEKYVEQLFEEIPDTDKKKKLYLKHMEVMAKKKEMIEAGLIESGRKTFDNVTI
jgi:hypothetical protein